MKVNVPLGGIRACKTIRTLLSATYLKKNIYAPYFCNIPVTLTDSN